MPYIGNTIRAADDYRLIDDISSSFNGSTTSFALQVAGSAPVPFPKSPQQVLISVNGVIQEPDPTGASGFNLVGTNIVFSSAPTNGHAFFGIIYATADYLNAGGNFPSGSTGAPSLTFIGDEDTGLYRKGSGSIGFVSNSTEIANTDSNGITISSGNLILGDSAGASSDRLVLGASSDLSIYHDGSNSFVDNNTNDLVIRCDGDDLKLLAEDDIVLRDNDDSTNFIQCINGGAVELFHNGSKKFETTSAGISVSGTIDSTGNINSTNNIEIDVDNGEFRCGAGGDFKISHSGSENILRSDFPTVFRNGANNETLAQLTPNGAVKLHYDNSKKFETTSTGAIVSGTSLKTQSTGSVNVLVGSTDASGAAIILDGDSDGNGSGADYSYIEHDSNGDLNIVQDNPAAGGKIEFLTGGAGRVSMQSDKFRPANNNAMSLGTSGLRWSDLYLANDLFMADDGIIKLGASNDLQIYHDGSQNIINGAAGQNLEIQTNAFRVNNQADSETMIVANANDAVELYYDNGKKLETTSEGIQITSSGIPAAIVKGTGSNRADVRILATGTGNAYLWLDAANGDLSGADYAFIEHDNTTLDLEIVNYANDVIIKNRNGTQGQGGLNTAIHCHENGSVDLHHDGTIKYETGAVHSFVFGSSNGNEAGLKIRNTNTNAGSRAELRLEAQNNASFATIFCDHVNQNLRMGYNSTGTTVAIDGNGDFVVGNIIPFSDNTKNLGSASFRWANIYTTDLKLSNEGSQNDVDGTWGNYTIQEGHEDLFLINHRTGKKFKFNLTEVS